MDTLREHLRKIATDRQKALKKKLGPTKYRKSMQKMSRKRKKKPVVAN